MPDYSILYERTPVSRTSEQDRTVTLSDLSADQKEAHDAVIDQIKSGESFVSLAGLAGTGKSTLIPLIAKTLQNIHCTGFCSLTGKAANVLQRKLAAANIHNAAHVGTIHSMMYQPVCDEHGRILRWTRNPVLISPNGTPIDRVFIDEASMIGTRILGDLMRYNVPIIAVGDPGQLPPIQDDPVIDEPDIFLKKIHRQAQDNPIISLAHAIRHEGDIPKRWPASDTVRFTDKEKGILPVLADGFSRLGLNFGIMVRTNRLRQDFNLMARSSPLPEPGDILICLKNAPPVFNGMRGILEKISAVKKHWYNASIRFPDDGLTIHGLISKHQFGTDRTIESKYDVGIKGAEELGLLFDFGSAMTVHKAQGSAFDECVLIPQHFRDPDRDYAKWLYTGVTRATNKITIAQ